MIVEKKVKKSKWWREAYDTVLFVQATPDEELMRRVQDVCDKEKM